MSIYYTNKTTLHNCFYLPKGSKVKLCDYTGSNYVGSWEVVNLDEDEIYDIIREDWDWCDECYEYDCLCDYCLDEIDCEVENHMEYFENNEILISDEDITRKDPHEYITIIPFDSSSIFSDKYIDPKPIPRKIERAVKFNLFKKKIREVGQRLSGFFNKKEPTKRKKRKMDEYIIRPIF
jgi:hypothetical protein